MNSNKGKCTICNSAKDTAVFGNGYICKKCIEIIKSQENIVEKAENLDDKFPDGNGIA